MNQVTATRLKGSLDDGGFPSDAAWTGTEQVTFCSDWRAENPDPMRETSVRLLWSHEHLFIRFHCRYREIFVYPGAACRRDKLWLRDVAELFIQHETDELRRYREFEISPNGDFLDLEIAPGSKKILYCDLRSRAALHHEAGTWTAEIAIPMNCLTPSFDPGKTWRLNFFRIEGQDPRRFYSSWIPTFAPQPNFHVPEVFAALKFRH